MIELRQIKGAIFDVDDTLLDNQTGAEFGTLHETTRRRAIHKVAAKYSLKELLELTQQDNFEAFTRAKYHSLDGAVWQILFEKGVVDTDELDPENELLKEIVLLKNELHAGTLRQLGRAVLGAEELVVALSGAHDLQDKMAIASSGVRRDIDIFLDEITALRPYFPDERVISHESVPHGKGKPHPEPFHLAFKTLDLNEEDKASVVAFEDDPRGVRSARAAGLYVCAITTRYKDHDALKNAGAHIVVDEYTQIMDSLTKRI